MALCATHPVKRFKEDEQQAWYGNLSSVFVTYFGNAEKGGSLFKVQYFCHVAKVLQLVHSPTEAPLILRSWSRFIFNAFFRHKSDILFISLSISAAKYIVANDIQAAVMAY